MVLTIYGRERVTKEGKHFPVYSTRLTDAHTGEELVVSVKFTRACNPPDLQFCPMNISVEKNCISYGETHYTKKDASGSIVYDERTGEAITGISRTVWVKQWAVAKKKFVDTSMDRFVVEDDEDF